ncbi:MAG: uracil-DNA glycosylase family protein, partial [Candidatus Bathyarchaeia archaeon]
LIKPRLIITLGATALKYFYPGSYVSDLHGRFLEYEGTTIFPTYHPAAVFRKSELREVMRRDFAYLGRHIGGRKA